MYEFHVRNIHTDEKKILFGYTANDACRHREYRTLELGNRIFRICRLIGCPPYEDTPIILSLAPTDQARGI